MRDDQASHAWALLKRLPRVEDVVVGGVTLSRLWLWAVSHAWVVLPCVQVVVVGGVTLCRLWLWAVSHCAGRGFGRKRHGCGCGVSHCPGWCCGRSHIVQVVVLGGNAQVVVVGGVTAWALLKRITSCPGCGCRR